MVNLKFTVNEIINKISKKKISLEELINEIYRRIDFFKDNNCWNYIVPYEENLRLVKQLAKKDKNNLPLLGVPFSIKDNIHIKNIPTTASCNNLNFIPNETSSVVDYLISLGAIFIGKNNMDEFATGLVGTRCINHPYNTFDKQYIPGGSSSGSAVCVANGLVAFSLGSDTGGSGRVPASLNNIVGFKPTPGLINSDGMVYANQSFDCIPIFANNCADVEVILNHILKLKKHEIHSKPINLLLNNDISFKNISINIPDDKYLNFFGDQLSEISFNKTVIKLKQSGTKINKIDFSLFLEAGEMVFEGPILAERLSSINSYFPNNEIKVSKVIETIINKASKFSALKLYETLHRIALIKLQINNFINDNEFLVVPTTGTIYKIKEVQNNPINLNKNMGYYTYFANLLELSGLAIPSGMRPDNLPFGICIYGKSGMDLNLLKLGKEWEAINKLEETAL